MPVVAGMLNNWVLFRDCETDMWCCYLSSRTIRRLLHTLDIDGESKSDVHKENIEIQLNSCYCWGGELTNKMRDPVANLSPTSVWQRRVKNNMLLLPEIEKIRKWMGAFKVLVTHIWQNHDFTLWFVWRWRSRWALLLLMKFQNSGPRGAATSDCFS